MKILEITAFSAGICGVWTRVQNEAEQLSKKGHEVTVFSSNIERGSGKIAIAKEEDVYGKVKIKRFKTKGHFGANTFFWDYEDEALRIKPDLIITHAYRQYYSTNALKIAKKLNIPCILVTHAPFLDKKLRSWKLNLAVKIYDRFIGKRILNKYSKILTITKWENSYLEKLKVNKNKIELIPNGIPEEFFRSKTKKGKGIFFFGRIAPIKNIEILIEAFCLIKDKKIKIDLIGPSEDDYIKKLKLIIKEKNLQDRIKFHPPIFDLKKKISLIDKYDIFILPSKREAMPQALIEVMAREKLVISSDTEGGKEIIVNHKNGLLFENGNAENLARKIEFVIKNKEKMKQIKLNARKDVRKFSWKILADKINKIITSIKK
jgi:glycosyltransferase involved in cell wall biosynthesis